MKTHRPSSARFLYVHTLRAGGGFRVFKGSGNQKCALSPHVENGLKFELQPSYASIRWALSRGRPLVCLLQSERLPQRSCGIPIAIQSDLWLERFASCL